MTPPVPAGSARRIVPVALRSVTLGEGRTKVCVPLVARDAESMAAAASRLPVAALDLVEVRVDHLDAVRTPSPGTATGADEDLVGHDATVEPAAVTAALAAVRGALPEQVPVLATFRSRSEGGEHELSDGGYEDLLALLVESGLCDAVDVEVRTPREPLARVVAHAHASGVPVVMSSHDFAGTPQHGELVRRLRTQQELGADVVKVAVMPRTPKDVLTLLAATEEFVERYATRPAITMAMGGLGVASRLVGETFGTCLTFGAAGRTSAPGQVDVHELRRVVDLVHATAGHGGRR